MNLFGILSDVDNSLRVKNRSYGNGGRLYSIGGKGLFNGRSVCQTKLALSESDDKRPITITYECKSIADDASLVVLESLIYDHCLRNPDVDLSLSFPKLAKSSFGYEMIARSLLFKFRDGDKLLFRIKPTDYIVDFESRITTIPRCPGYLRQICYDSNDGANFAGDVETSLSVYSCIPESFKESINETICEIISNASEHGRNLCIAQVKTLDGFKLKPSGDNVVYVSCSFVSYSDNTISSTIKDSCDNKVMNSKGLNLVNGAYEYHKSYFCDTYDKDSFYMISAFQLGVSSRPLGNEGGGGTGLTALLRELQKHSLAEQCYVLSGNTCLYFINDQILVNDDGTVGFNESSDYQTLPPSRNSCVKMRYSFHGTIYNLIFIIRKEQR